MPSSTRYRRSLRLWNKLKPQARRMRSEPTAAEAVLWERLRRNRVAGFSFRRQHAIGRFIVDFCCPRACLVIELDGGVHDARETEDAIRQRFLEERGYRVLRFRNPDVLDNADGVVRKIADALRELEEQAGT